MCRKKDAKFSELKVESEKNRDEREKKEILERKVSGEVK